MITYHLTAYNAGDAEAYHDESSSKAFMVKEAEKIASRHKDAIIVVMKVTTRTYYKTIYRHTPNERRKRKDHSL